MNNYVQRMVCITQSVTADKYIKSPVRAEQGMGLSVWNLSVKESGGNVILSLGPARRLPR